MKQLFENIMLFFSTVVFFASHFLDFHNAVLFFGIMLLYWLILREAGEIKDLIKEKNERNRTPKTNR